MSRAAFMTAVALGLGLSVVGPARAQCEHDAPCPDGAAELSWPEPAGERPAGALGPTREAVIDDGFVTTGSILFASGYLCAVLLPYLYAGLLEAEGAHEWLLVPWIGGALTAAMDEGSRDLDQVVALHTAVALPGQLIGLAMVLVAVLVPTARRTRFEEGVDLAVVPAAEGALAGLSLRGRW